jgi:cell division protein FtsX
MFSLKFAVVAAILFVPTLAAPSQSNLNKLKRAEKPVENSYIVVLKDDASRDDSLRGLRDLVVAFDEVKEIQYSNWTGENCVSFPSVYF